MEVDIEGRRTCIDPEWNRYRLQENLQKIGLSLTSIHAAVGQQISAMDSLAVCLIQHASNRYDGISNLDEVWDSVVSSTETKEEDWIRFRIQLEKKRRELPTLVITHFRDLETVVGEVLQVLYEFKGFQLTSSRNIDFTFFAGKWAIPPLDRNKKKKKRASKIQLEEEHGDSSDVAKCFIWYDEEAAVFNGIAKWSQTFADPQVYRLALLCQLVQSLKNFFRLMLNKGNPDDDELVTRITCCLENLTNCGKKIEDHEALLLQWNCSDDGLKILMKELLNPNFVECNNRRDEIEKELRKEFIESLEKATEEIQIERLESYEKARLEAIEKKEEAERQKRRLNSQIKASEREIAEMERELDEEQSDTMLGRNDTPSQQPGAQLSLAAMFVLQKRDNLRRKKEKLAWDRFLSLLGRSRPRYELVRQRRDHRLFSGQYDNVTDFADKILNEFVLKESFLKEGGDLSNLMSYIQHNTSDAKSEIIRLLEEMVKEPMQSTTNPTWKFDGNALVLSQILDKVKPKMPLTCEEIHICAASVIYIDCDWVVPGISLAISAPRIETVGLEKRTIDTSGRHAQKIEKKDARNGVGPGVSGEDGLNGETGQSAGHVQINCDTFHGLKLSIIARGGNGADGQNGGNGMPGSDGKDGEDAKLRPPADVNQNFSYIPLTLLKYLVPGWNVYEMSRSVVHYYQGSEFAIKYLEKGKEGESGIAGGCGGSGGSGGQGGLRGHIDIQCQFGKHLIDPVAEDGDSGQNGTPGKGATGGKGGRNGWDAARVFTPNNLNPWFYISGNWVEDKGNLSIEDVHCTSNNAVLGCKIVKKDQDKGVAADGQEGQNGQQSQRSEKNTAVSKKAMTRVNADWKKEESTAASLADLEQSIRADAASLQSAEAAAYRHEELSKVSAENEKRVRAAAEEEEANKQKFKHAKEMEERIKKEFQKAKKMCTAQSMQSQRTNKISDQLPNETETKEEAEEFDSTDTTIQTMQITSSDEWDSLEGVPLLDALIDKFSDDTEKSQTLSMLTQSLVLQIRQQDLWIEVTTIVRRHVDCVDDLIQSLKYINQDIELGQLFAFNKEEQHLNDLQRAVQVKTSGWNLFNDADNKKSTLATIYYFQQLVWTYDELVTLLKPLESVSSPEKSESNARKQLIEILGNRLVSVVASQLPGINQERVLTNLLQCCHRNSSSPVLFGTFFNNLVRELTTNTSSDQEKETTLNQFIQEKLAVRLVKDLLPSKMRAISIEQLDKLVFLLNNVKTDVKDLDDIRSRVTTLLEKDKVEEKDSFKSVLLLIEKAFEQFYWNHEWNEIQKMLVRLREKIQRQSTDAAPISKEAAMERDAFQDSADRLKVALTWTYCRKSYQQKLDICSELKKRFKTTGWKDLVKIALKKQREFSMEKTVRFLQSIEWIKKREIDIIGSFKHQGEKTDKASFVEFVERLLEVKPKKVDVDSMRPQLQRALHFLHHNRIVSFTAAEVISLNKLFDKSRFGLVRDESFCRDEADLRAEYLLNWKERYFLRWTDCYAEIDRIWKKLRENWKENCINADLVAEPTKVIRQMDVLLNRYNFLTSLFLSPTQSVKQWQSLSEEPPENLEQLIKTRIWQDFSQIFRQLMDDVVTKINQLLVALKLESKIQQITHENYQESEKNLLQVLDSLVTVAAQCDEGSENEKRLSTLMPDVELLIVCQVELDGSDPARTSNIVSQLEDWKESINLMGKNRTSAENPKDYICKSLSKMLHLVLWSVTGDESLIEELIHKDQQNRQDVERAIASLESFIGHLFMANEIEKLDICRATVLVLKDGQDLSPWRLAFGKKQDQQLLVDKQIDIWQECVTEKKFHLPKMDSWKELISKKKVFSTIKSAAAFVEVLLTSSSHSMVQLRLAVVTQILDQHMKPLEDVASMLERWSGLVATISTWSEVQTDEKITSQLVAVEICLIRHLAAFIGRWLKQKKVKKSIEFNFKEIINQLSVAANFLGRTEVQANLLVFGGLMHLAKTSSTDTVIDELNPLHFVAQYIQHLINSVSKEEATKIYGLKKQPIIQVLYSNDDKNQQQEPDFTTLEKAYVERWLQTKSCCQSNDRIRDLYEKIQSVKKGAAKTKENRLFSSVGFELFTREEKRYIIIVGRDVAEELLRTQQPLSYMHVLKERAVQKIYQSFLKHFYPEQSTELLDRQPSTAEAQNPKSNEPMDPHDNRNCIDDFQRAFNRAHFFSKREGVEFEWLIWLQETVLRSIVSTRDQVGLALVTEIMSSSIEFTPEQLFSWTTMSRPHRWIDDALVNSIINATAQLKTKPPTRNAAGGDQLDSLKSDLQCCLKSHQQKGRTVLKIFLRKLEQEAKLHSAGDPIDLLFVTRIVAEIKALQRIDDIGRFQETSLRQWMRLIRHARLADEWPSSLTDQLTTILDRRLGHDKTDRFLQRFNSKFSESLSGNASSGRNHEKILDDMLKNLSKYPWIVDQFFALANEEVGQQDDNLWEFIQNRELIEMDKEKASKANLDATQIIDMLKNDIGSSAIVGGLQQQKKLIEQVKEIKRLALEDWESWDNQTIKEKWTCFKEWSENRKKVSKSERLDPVDFLSVAFLAVELKEKHHLRDAQLLAVLIFVSSANQQSGSQIGRRMAQISTGEGKTLITALLVVYHVLDNWSNGRRFVDIITSSSVLAEENVKEMQWFFDLFGIVVANNCDAACTEDESLRCKRYNSDVIYGDMSSFQRDILLSNFFSERKITGGRKTGAIVVDEVDSMLLDKGENILYLSHKIPEMDDLTQVFVEIWNAVHAPDVAMSDESAQAKVYRYMKLRLEEGEIAIPKCLDTYVHRHLLAWTRNAFRAKNLVTTKDSYKVDDVGDGRGQQIVIMDKETGVEQAQMHWSQGLHQFLQLKHTLKLSPVSLKAVFMSNIGFFKQHEGAALYGMTGTLGSTAECQLLHDVFNVDFFKMPRFKRRFCLEEDPLLASSKGKWLTNINKATQTQLYKGRAVLIVCENIAAAEAIYQKLLKSDDKVMSSKIVKYVSSFDTEFQTKQRNTALGPGDVIVATNLAGRGTDFKINEQLAKNGGLHVVIGYMPPNARVESQIEGRVARAGQPGSFQFVLCHSSVKSKEDSISELLRLKVKRDDKECRRLETIRNRGLEKIYLEEKLFDRFHQEIYNKMKKELDTSPDCEMQMKFLTNRWALWLDENAEHINNVHLKKTDNVVEKNFQNFKKECQGLRHLPLAFALTPSELMLLGDFYETSPKVKTDVTKSGLCYDKVIKGEPSIACEGALMRKVKLILQEATFDQKKEAKVLLKRVKTLIKQKIEFLMSTSELVKFTSQANQRAGGAVPSENRFEEQITNQLSLLQIHLTAVEDILGRPVGQMLGMHFQQDEEFRELLNVIEARADLCKPYRLTKKINFFQTDNDDEAICIKRDQTQKTVKWPSCLDHCQTQTIHLIKAKHQKKSYAIEKTELESVIVTRDQLWETLIEEGFVGQEEMIEQQIICWANQEMDDESVKKLLDNLPKELVNYNGLLVNWLQSHEGEDYTAAVGTLGLSPEHSSVLEDFLKTNKILIYVDERHGKLLKTLNFKSDTDLPEKLRKHYCLLSAWTLSVDGARMEIDDDVSREDLPCPKDRREAVDQLWSYLIEQGVIKESKIVFSHGLRSDKDVIEERKNQIKTTLDTSLSSVIDDICRKHRPVPERVTEVSYIDIPAYLADNKRSALAVTAFTFMDPYDVKKLFNREKENMKKWKTEQQTKQHLDSYRAEVNMALEKSIGQLKTIPRVTASFQPLSKYFMSDPNTKRFPAEEIQSFQDKTFDGVITLKAVQSWGDYWDWRVFFVAMFAVAQISASVAVTALSGGTMPVLAGALMAEGVGDMMFAITNGVSGNFSWSSYGWNKLWSVGMTIATAGLSSYLTKGAIAGKAAATGLQGKVGLSLFFAAAKKALAKCGEAILSYLISLGVDKFLTWLKTFIIENIIVHIKFLISKALYPLFDTLAAKLEKIWALMKKLGRQVGEAIGLINADLDKASTSELYTIWGKRVVGKVASLMSSIGGCFAESGGVWKAQGTEEFKVNDAVGLISKKTSFKFVEYAKKATTIVKYLKIGAEIAGLVLYAPEYVNNVNQTLDAKIRKLEDEIEIEEEKKKSTAAVQYHQIITSDSESFESEDEVESDDVTESTMLSTAATERRNFNEFKEEVKGRVEGDISKYMVDSVTRAWVQPWLQSKIEGMVEHYGKKTFQAIGSMCQGSDITGTSNSADQGNNKGDQQTASAGKAEADAEKLKDSLGEDGCEIQKDRNGNAVVEPKTYEEVVDGIGGGKTAGLLEMQMIADALNCKLEIVDTVGDFAKNGSGSFEIDPEGKATGTIQVKYSANENGTKHVTLIGPDGKEIDLPPAVDANGQPAPPNRCLYDAVAKAQNCSTDQLLDQVKTHATGNKMARYLYDEKVGEACPGLRVGNRTRKEGSKPADIYLHRDEEGTVRTVAASVTKENIGGGSNVTNSMYKALNDAGRKGEPNPTTTDGNNTDQNDQQKYHAGHVIGFGSGGKGGLKEKNVVNMAAELNLGPYKELETEFRKFVKVSDGQVHINVNVDEGIPSKDVDALNPVNFRFSWSSDDGKTMYRSSLLKNTKEGVQEYKDTPRAEKNEYFQGDYFENQRSKQIEVGNNPKPPENPILVAQPVASSNVTNIRSIYAKGTEETEDTKFKGSLLPSNIKYPPESKKKATPRKPIESKPTPIDPPQKPRDSQSYQNTAADFSNTEYQVKRRHQHE